MEVLKSAVWNWMCVWIPLILLKTENNKKKNKKVIVWALVTVHMPDCTVLVPWTVQQALDYKKKEAKNADLENADTKFKQILSFLKNLSIW